MSAGGPTAYDTFAYPANCYPATHPDRLAALATLFGMSPAPVDACRVLEIGCGDGGNLIPMAYFLPRCRFYGVDLAGAAIADGRRALQDLKLRNVELAVRD